MTEPHDTMPSSEKPSTTDAANTLSDLQQKVRQLEETLEARNDELATAEAQRDEVNSRLCETENRMSVERALHQAGVADVETATLLLEHRVDLAEVVTSEELNVAVEKLLLDKPFLRAKTNTNMPPATRTGHDESTSAAARMADLAQRAITSGSRRDVAEYLRQRRTNIK